MNDIDKQELYVRLKNALNALETERQKVKKLESLLHEPIAVVGMACNLPGGIEDTEAFWKALINNYDAVVDLPDSRWSVTDLVDSNLQSPGKMVSAQGGFLKDHEQFDAHFFGISPREALTLDPQQRLILKNTWRSLEHACIAPDSIKGSNTGVFVGVTNIDYGHALLKEGKIEDIDGYSATGTAMNVIAGRLSYFLDIHGPSVVMDTACSSSLVALHYACQSLRANECKMALCSGVNVILLPEGNIALSQANMLSPQGRCYSFDEKANGYVRGEGCISLVLKLHSEALKAEDKIYALIKGSAVNHGGKSSGLTVPNAKAQAQLIRTALQNSGVKAEDIAYIETHGTGTALGDPIEINALNEVFAKSHSQEKPLWLGSVKTNFGHLESASGLLGLLKVIVSMNHGQLPPNLHFEKLNPLIELEPIPAQIISQQQSWLGEQYAGVSSFGFSGINAHVVVASAPPINSIENSTAERTYHLLTCSAKDSEALAIQKKELSNFIEQHPEINLANLAYNYTNSLNHFAFRQAFVIKDCAELLEKLHNPAQTIPTTNKKRRVAFLFSGQGSQYLEMGHLLYETSPTFKLWIDTGCELLNASLGYSLHAVMFGTEEDKLNQTINTQPALFIFNYALAKLWMSWGIIPEGYIGHSIGEYVAATLAGIMSYEEALKLVFERARLMQSLPSYGSMLLVMASKEQVQLLLDQANYAVDIAIVTDEYTVLSGLQSDLQHLEKNLGFPVKPLVVSHAFHSSLMEPILAEFQHLASQVSYHPPKKQVISNIHGKLYESSTVNAEYWTKHLREAVDLRESMNTLIEQHYDVLLEIGPRPTFSKSSKQLDKLSWNYSLRQGVDNWHSLLMNLANLYELGMDVNWKQFEADYKHQKIVVPGYPFQEKKYWALAAKQTSYSKDKLKKSLYAVKNKAQALIKAADQNWDEPLLLLTDDETLATAFKKYCPQVLISPDFKEQAGLKHIVYAMKNSPQKLELALKDHYQQTLALFKKILAMQQKGITLWLVDSANNLEKAPLIGLRKCLMLETADVDCRSITLDLEQDYEQSSKQILAEIQAASEEKQIIYQNAIRYVPRLESLFLKEDKQQLIDKEALYLISGGQGALGLLVVSWYMNQGATNILVLSRSKATAEMQALIEKGKANNCHVECLALDVSDKKALKQLFSQFGKQKPVLKGIVHAAGVLEDALILNQTWARFEGLYQSKILGGWNLHELSLKQKLDHFVCFSSMASLLGTPGQANYAAANAFLDSLCAYRQSKQLPALSINWGPWAQIGMAKDIKSYVAGLNKLAPEEGMALFDSLMHSYTPSQVLAASIDWTQAFQYGISIPFLEYLTPQIVPSQKSVWNMEELRASTASNLKQKLVAELQIQFQNILRLDKPLTLTQNFFELGMDSLMAIELRNNLQALLQQEVSLSQTLLFELSTLDDLSNYLVQIILEPKSEKESELFFSTEEQLLASLDELSEEEIDALLKDGMDDEK